MPVADSSRWWGAAEGFLVATLVVLPWSFGGSPAWTTPLLLALSAGAYFTWAIGAARNHRRWAAHPVLLVPAFALVVGLIQLVPLPASLLAHLSAPGAELREFALVPLGLERLRPISMDPPSTARTLARVVALTGLLVTALELGRIAVVRRRLIAVIALTGVSIALCGLGHLLAGETALFGVHQFEGFVRLVTPFGNTNHLAGYLALCGSLALALALDSERDVALGWAIAAAVCGLSVFLTFSRGGIVWFVATWLLIGAAFLAQRGGGWRAVLPWVLIGGTILFAGLLAFDQLVERADTVADVEKLRATKMALWPMLANGALKYWPLGLGLGAFELGFARFQTELLTVTFTHPENVGLQWLAEVGLPLSLGFLLLCGALGWKLWRSVRGTLLERSVLFAVVGAVLHDVFDFALELNALAPAVTVLVGLLAANEAPSRRRKAVRFRAVGAGLGFAGLAVFAASAGLPTHLTVEQRVAALLRQGRPLAAVRAEALAGIDRHPADWVLYANVATENAQRGDPREALAWLNRLLFLRPSDPRAHVAAAQALLRLKRPTQALGEYKAAWELGDYSSLGAGLAVAKSEGLWERVLVAREGHLTAAYGVLSSRGSVSDARALLQAASEFPPDDAVAAEGRVLRVLLEAEAGDARAAQALLDALPVAAQALPALRLVRPHLLVKQGRQDAALREFERLHASEPAHLDVGLELAGLLATMGRPVAALEVVERLKPFASTPALRSMVFQREGELWAQQERWGRAIEAFQTATRIEATRADLHYRVAELFERMGSVHSALDALRQGRVLDSPEGVKSRDAWMKRLEAMQAPIP